MRRALRRACVWVLAAFMVVPGGRPRAAWAEAPKKIAVVDVLAVAPDEEVARSLNEEIRLALGRKKVFETLPPEVVAEAIRRSGVKAPVPSDDETLAKIGELAGADAVFLGRFDKEGGFEKVRGRLVKVETRGTWRRAEEFCLCRTEEGRRDAADRLADELAGTRHFWPSRKRWIAILGAAALGGIAALIILNNTKDEPVQDGLPPIPNPPN